VQQPSDEIKALFATAFGFDLHEYRRKMAIELQRSAALIQTVDQVLFQLAGGEPDGGER
jgi:hypothetical protein